MKVTIAGAGLAGALLAVLLARRGFDVTVLERRPDLRKVAIAAGRSINLALANRGIAALRAAGVMDRVEPLLIPMRGRMLHLADGETTLSPYGQRDDEVIFSVSRCPYGDSVVSPLARCSMRPRIGISSGSTRSMTPAARNAAMPRFASARLIERPAAIATLRRSGRRS